MADIEALYRDMADEDLRQPITESAVEGELDWSAKDHLAHLVQVEGMFRAAVERALGGDPDPADMGGVEDDQEAISRQDHINARTVADGRVASRDELLRALRESRAQTLAVVDGCSDEQLGSRVPGSRWGDGSVGGVFSTVAGHHGRHLLQVQGGLESRRAEQGG